MGHALDNQVQEQPVILCLQLCVCGGIEQRRQFILKTLEQMAEYWGGERKASISREISKKFEETVRGTLSELIIHFTEHPPKGEFVMVVAGYNK